MDDCPETTEESGSGANAANICLVSVIHQGSAMLGSVPFISWVLVLCSVTWCLKDTLSHPCFPDLCAVIWFSSLHLAQRAAQRHAPIPSWWEKIWRVKKTKTKQKKSRGRLMPRNSQCACVLAAVHLHWYCLCLSGVQTIK